MSDLFRSPPETKLTFKEAFLWILLSVFLISGPAAIALYYYQGVRQVHVHDSKYNIVALVQTGPEKEPLKTTFLAELLDLSVDHPTNLYQFSTYEAKKKLLECTLIKDAEVKKIKPGTVYVDYTVRQPVAFLGDFTNTAVDLEGSLFPFKPFFAPKKLPEIYLGAQAEEQQLQWGSKSESLRLQLALTVLRQLNMNFLSKNTYLQRIDVSKADAPSYGQREIILVFEDWTETDYTSRPILCCYPIILRVSPATYITALSNFQNLKKELYRKFTAPEVKDEKQVITYPVTVIDFRLPHLAFIKYG